MLNDGDYITRETLLTFGEERYKQLKDVLGCNKYFGSWTSVRDDRLAGVFFENGNFYLLDGIEDIMPYFLCYRPPREITLDEILFYLL